MDAVDSSGLVVPVSVWSYKLNDVNATTDTQGYHRSATIATSSYRRRRLVVLEPVNSVTAHVVFDSRVSITVIICSIAVA